MIMTTKELLRRLESFSSLDIAARLFIDCEQDSDVPFVFRVVKDGNVSYTLSYFLDLPDNLVYCSVERFSRAVFNTQLRYFKSFFSRASKTQQEYIRKSMLVDNLLKLC